MAIFLLCPYMTAGSFLGSPGLHPHDLNISQRLHLQIPLYWELGFNIGILEWEILGIPSIQSIAAGPAPCVIVGIIVGHFLLFPLTMSRGYFSCH